jgi:hypothetical protein
MNTVEDEDGEVAQRDWDTDRTQTGCYHDK